MSRKDTVIIGLRMTFWELCCMNHKGHHRGPSNKFPLESVWHLSSTGSRHSLGGSFCVTSVGQLCLWRGREKHNRSVNPWGPPFPPVGDIDEYAVSLNLDTCITLEVLSTSSLSCFSLHTLDMLFMDRRRGMTLRMMSGKSQV